MPRRSGTRRKRDEERFAIHLLDVGPNEYGDAALCVFDETTVLIDGGHKGDDRSQAGHPSIPQQLERLLDQQGPVRVSLLIVTHTHDDHIGCLPELVRDGKLLADWALVADPALGYGRPVAPPDAVTPSPAPRDPRVIRLAAALHEEPRLSLDSNALLQFLDDLANQEQRYGDMLTTLEQNGTRVVRYGRDDHGPLLTAFADIGLRIIGPSTDQLVICAEAIAEDEDDAVRLATDLFRQDAAFSLVEAYRQISRSMVDALDAGGRPGAAVNNQSLVTRFAFRNRTLLFTGDMQLVAPGVTGLGDLVDDLRREIEQDGPYDFVKISHHGSSNAFDARVLEEMGDVAFLGICTGVTSNQHPSPKVLQVLRENAGTLTWARTDRNGLTTLNLAVDPPTFVPSSLSLNDDTPAAQDIASIGTTPAPAIPAQSAGSAAAVAPLGLSGMGTASVEAATPPSVVEVVTKVPHVATRVSVTIDVAPTAPMAGNDRPTVFGETRPTPVNIAGGRPLPELVFVTSRDALAANLGQVEAASVLQGLREQAMALYDDLPPGTQSIATAAAWVRSCLRNHPRAEGIVLIGGYDVVPAQRIDVLDPALRERLPSQHGDPDDFIVWSDDIYGDIDAGGGDGLPELPVSRIPDGKTPELVFAAIQASNRPSQAGRSGLRNVSRPFADDIFTSLPGEGSLLTSEPARFDQQPSYSLTADAVYLMLHGDYADGSRFWGEYDGEEGIEHYPEAMNVGNVPSPSGPVTFTGCCWGALTVDTLASRVVADRPVEQKTPRSSVALAFLARGATAFVGCTGAHYSPLDPPFDHFGGPFHAAFWRRVASGVAPAKALLDAKVEFIGGMPHGRTEPLAQAIEMKIWRQYTCLGLGW